jgi:hypothetical protein
MIHLEGKESYLPKSFHYDGMHKIKAGKGYKHGKPQGVKSGPCDECNGTIISIKMNTSSKGFETTSEKVCDTCGLVYQGAFNVIDKYHENYSSYEYNTHQEWMKANKPIDKSNEDVAWDNELFEHKTGQRPNTSDNVGYGGTYEQQFNNINDSNWRLNQANARLARTPQSMKISSNDRNTHEYHLIADDYIHELGLNKYDAMDVHYYIDHRDTLFKLDYKADDIILCICLYVMGQRMDKLSFGRLTKQIYKTDRRKKKIYSLVRDKLSS